MKPTLNEKRAGCGETRRLLFAKTPGDVDTAFDSKSQKVDALELKDRFDLMARFPNLLIGKVFEEHAISRMKEKPGYCGLILRLDDACDNHTGDLGVSVEMVAKMTGILDDACNVKEGVWGQSGVRDFGWAFPEKDTFKAQKSARALQEKIRERCGLSVSLGGAIHPFLSYKNLDLFENARKSLAHAAFLGPGALVFADATTLNISGDNFYQRGQIKKAVKEYKMGLSLDPGNVNLHNSLGVCYGVLREYDKALSRFETAIKLDPNDAMGHYNTGHVHMVRGDLEEALACFQTAESKEKNIFEVVFQLGRLYLEMNQPGKAREYLEKACSLKPDGSGSHRCLGHALKALGDNQSALSHYKKAVKLHPSDAESLSAMGYLYQLKGEDSEITLLFCRKSVELCPDNGDFWKVLGEVYHMQDNPEEAFKAFEKAKSLGVDMGDALETVKREMVDRG